MSNASVFFVGAGTTILLLGAGLGGGLLFAKAAIEPVAQHRETAANRLAPARVILPAYAEPAPAPNPSEAASPVPVNGPKPQGELHVVSAKDVQVQSGPAEKDKQVERTEQRKAEAAQRESRRRYAERKARREAARAKQQQAQEQQETRRQQQSGIVASSADDEHSKSGALFVGRP
jgi:type IV secretory pathway VirJ component